MNPVAGLVVIITDHEENAIPQLPVISNHILLLCCPLIGVVGAGAVGGTVVSTVTNSEGDTGDIPAALDSVVINS